MSLVDDSVCGRRYIKPIEPDVESYHSGSSRVVAGYEVYPPHSQPWIVAFANPNRQLSSCAGTLIHPNFVISAMHCFESKGDLFERSIAVLGLHDKENPGDQSQWIKIKNLYPDPRIDIADITEGKDYWRSYDLIMLELETPANLGKDFPNVGIACLGEASKTYDGYLTYIIGWGLKEN